MPCPVHEPPYSVVAQGLEVSRGDVFQHQLLQAQLRDQTLQLRVLLLKLLQPTGSAETEATRAVVVQRWLVRTAAAAAPEPCMVLRLREREDLRWKDGADAEL
jgi:hypothetical protein